jgi:hypothetical protein
VNQVSPFLRRTTDGYAHWCPACEEIHVFEVPKWTFDGNLTCPTFAPSMSISWGDPTRLGAKAGEMGARCHYNLTAGILHYHPDCTHTMRHTQVPLPVLPSFMRDPEPRAKGPRRGWAAHLNGRP